MPALCLCIPIRVEGANVSPCLEGTAETAQRGTGVGEIVTFLLRMLRGK